MIVSKMYRTNIIQQTDVGNTLPLTRGVLQRKCACGNKTVGGGECTECAKKKNNLQRKLAIGASNDPLERKADRVADQVLSVPANSADSLVSRAPLRIQRYEGQAPTAMEIASASVGRALASSGSALEPSLRQDMEQRFGYDFSQVRVHTGGAAEQSASDVKAHSGSAGKRFLASSYLVQRLDDSPTTDRFVERQGIVLYEQLRERALNPPRSIATDCTPNPRGSHLPSVGTTHRRPDLFHMLPCFISEEQLENDENWCVDSFQNHRGEKCYRRIPRDDSIPTDQYCYSDNGCCHNSRDSISPVSSSSIGAGRICQNSIGGMVGHFFSDYLRPKLGF